MASAHDDVYNYPQYFEMAYNFRNLAAEVQALEAIIARFSDIPVRRILELGCGSAPHLPELRRRGYHYVGVDLSAAMLAHARERAGEDAGVTLVQADLASFALDAPVDFAMNLLGSLYVQSTDALVAHFDSVSRALRPGGLYLLDWALTFAAGPEELDGWEVELPGVRLGVTYETRLVNATEQLVEETLTLVVDDAAVGAPFTLQQVALQRVIYPQEFRLLIQHRPDFAFVGWWDDWDLNAPLDRAVAAYRPIVVVKREAISPRGK